MNQRNRSHFFFFFVVLFFFVFGLSVGAFTEVFLEDGLYYETAGYMQQVFQGEDTGLSSREVFWNALKSNGVLLALMTAGGITVIGFPLTLFVLAYKGASLGFTLALIGEALGIRGILSSMPSLLLQNLILIPMFLIFSFATLHVVWRILFHCQEGGFRRHGGRGNRKMLYRAGMEIYSLCFLGAAAALLAGCFAQAYFGRALLYLFS